jgi:MFS family permease
VPLSSKAPILEKVKEVIKSSSLKFRALRFVLLIGLINLFADFVYEGSRGIIGPYLAFLGASAFTIAVVTGFGEFVGYAWRLVSGSLSDKTGQYWPITIFGYVIQMTSVPLLALVGSWQMAAVLIVLERFGRATRNPPRDVMLSYAAKEIGGYGWAFGLNEALDQLGALFGPLAAAGILAWRGDYRLAFTMLLIPALIMLSILAIARLTYPHPEKMDSTPQNLEAKGLPRVYWLYLIGAIFVAIGFADFPFMAYHLEKMSIVSPAMIPIFYALAMGVSGIGSLLFGRLFDKFGIIILVPLTIISALFAPLVFFGSFWVALIGVALWGLGMGVHESIIPAAVALMVPVQRRASAYGLFTAGYGIFWFLGSALIGSLYSVSLPSLIAFCLVMEFASLPLFFLVRQQIDHKS